MQFTKKFRKIVILDSVVFYPEHRAILEAMAEEILEYPSSLPESLERQYDEQPELFKDIRCFTQLGTNNTPVQLLMNRIADADCVISCWTNIPDDVLRAAKQLKLVVFWTHEKGHRINLSLAEELGISVVNVPDYGTDSVSEVVFAGLFELLARNPDLSQPATLPNAILHDLFKRYRLLADNEKDTRAGKFTHHFHKLGKVDFNFTKKTVDDLFPEHMLRGKRVGLLRVSEAPDVVNTLRGFDVVADSFDGEDHEKAVWHRFFVEHDLVYFDSARMLKATVELLRALYGEKSVDIRDLQPVHGTCSGKRFGVVGLGRIGARVASMATSLGYEVVYFSRTRKPELETDLGISFVTLEELMATSDVVSLHVTAHTADGLLRADLIQSMKPGAMLLNTADGNALDQAALGKRMEKNEVLAFLDVYPGLPRLDVLGVPLRDDGWKIKQSLSAHVLAYRAGWKTQESVAVKTYKTLGFLAAYLLRS